LPVLQDAVARSFSVDVEDAEYLRSLAKSQGLSLADVCRLALKQWQTIPVFRL